MRRRTSLCKLAVGASAIAASALLVPPHAQAAELGSEGEVASVEVHGFASQGFILTLGNDYLADNTKDGSFEFSEVGINFTKELTDTMRMGVQLFSQDRGRTGDYKPIVDWFYLDYRWQDWLGLRAGRLKIPYGLYNEIQDIDSARVPVLLPQSVYPLQAREFLFAHTGVELYGFGRSHSLGALEYRLFGGTIFLDSDSLVPPGLDAEFQVPYVFGARLLWETPLEGLRLAGSIQAVALDVTVFIPGIAPIEVENRSVLWVASAEYGVADLVLTAEFSRWPAEQETNTPGVSAPDAVPERAYAMATYRLTPWLQPGAYYSLLFPDAAKREGRENVQHDLSASLRFDINAHWLVKLEGHYMLGTAGLGQPLSLGQQPDLLAAEKRWAAFFLKTTAYF